jgi:hypothetical protein
VLSALFRTLRQHAASKRASDPAPVPAPAEVRARASELYRAGRHAAVLELLASLPPGAPRDAEALLLGANALQYQRRFAEAVAAYAQLIDALEGAGPQYRALLAATLIHCGLAQLRMNDFARAKATLTRAAELAPDDPPAIGCARFPDLMRRSVALPRAPLAASATARRNWPGADPALEIVYFFVAGSGTGAAEYFELLAASIASARRTVPGCRVALLTDRGTMVPARVRPDELRRYDLAAAQLMVSRFRAVDAYLAEKARARAPVLAAFCDPDIVVNRDLRDAFAAEFDVAVPVRSNFVDARLDHEPFTAGITFVQGRDAERPRRFFSLCLREFDAIAAWPEVLGFYPRPIHEWRGDQLVPAAIVGWREYAEHVLSGRTDRLEVDGVVAAFLPSDPFCFAFEPWVDAAELAAKYVIDFKGERKRFMLERFPAPAA